MTLGNKLQALRTAQGLSQEELAERLAVSRQAVSKWELDKTVPEVKYVVALSELYGVTTDYLLKEGEDAPPAPESPAAPAPGPSAPQNTRPAWQRATGLLICGSTLFCAWIFVYLGFYCADYYRVWPGLLVAVAVLAPVLLAVSRGLLGSPDKTELRRYRRAFAACTMEWGFAIAILCGFAEVVDDLLVGQVMGGFSLPLLVVLTAALLLPLWGAGVWLARKVSR